MVQISDRAFAIIDEMRTISGAADDEGIVLYREDDGGIGFAVGTPDEQDHVFIRDGQPIVILSEELALALDGYLLDLVTTAEGVSFTLVGPQHDAASGTDSTELTG